MSEPNQTSAGVSATTVLALVEALYAYAENPAHWNDITAAIEALPEPLDPARNPEAASIMSHAARAAAMIERLNAGRKEDVRASSEWDAVLLSSEGLVRGQVGRIGERLTNYLARPLADGKPLGLQSQTAMAFETALSSARSASESALAPFTLTTVDDTARCFGVVLPREAFPAGLAAAFGLGEIWAEPLFALVLLSARDMDTSGELAHRRLGLTAAESRLAAKLLQGLTVNDAARALGLTTNTARSYLKSIFAKTGSRRQTELLRLLEEAAEFPEQGPAARSVVLPGAPPRRFVTLEDGRRLYYREYGVPTGTPVIYFHMGLAASLMVTEAARAALNAGTRVIAFERPGFGQSDPRPDYTFDTIAADVEEFCRLLGLRTVTFFGDGYGGGFAVAAARRMGTTVTRIALHAPNLGYPQSSQNRNTGLAAMLHQPWIIPAATEILRRGLRISVIRSLLGYVGDKSRSDAARIADPNFTAYQNANIFDALERSGAGLSSELVMFANHARIEAMGIDGPIRVWHGDQNPSVPVANSVNAFATHENATLSILPGQGLYLRQETFEEIFAWLAGETRPRAGASA